jgi:hypothetical protein
MCSGVRKRAKSQQPNRCNNSTSDGVSNGAKGILKRKGNTLVEAFAGVIPDGARPPGRQPNLMFNADGTIRYRSPYTKNAKEKLLRWNESQHRFLP